MWEKITNLPRYISENLGLTALLCLNGPILTIRKLLDDTFLIVLVSLVLSKYILPTSFSRTARLKTFSNTTQVADKFYFGHGWKCDWFFVRWASHLVFSCRLRKGKIWKMQMYNDLSEWKTRNFFHAPVKVVYGTNPCKVLIQC